MKTTVAEIKQRLSITDVLMYYGAIVANKQSGAWWCPVHERGGGKTGHKTPSLVATNKHGTATCLSQGCFKSDDIFGVIAKMDGLHITTEFEQIKQKACEIAGLTAHKIHDSVQDLTEKHLRYLNGIGISRKTARFFGLKAKGDYILYPQIGGGYKGISIFKDKKTGKSKMFFEGKKGVIWGDVNDTEGKIVIFTEGEKDCMRLTEELFKCGLNNQYKVVTVTTGASSVPHNIKNILQNLMPKEVYIVYDNDKVGQSGAKNLAEAIAKNTTIYSFNKTNKDGYDVTDFLNEGNGFYDLLQLNKTHNRHNTLKYPTIEDIKKELEPVAGLIKTGYKLENEELVIAPGTISVFAAPTSHGKTTMQINLAVNIAKNHENLSVHLFSYEEQRCDILLKALNCYCETTLAENNLTAIKKEFIDPTNEDFSIKKHEFFDSMISNGRLCINYVEWCVEDLVNKIIDLKNTTNVGVVIIDYAQLLYLKNSGKLTRQEQLKEVCNILKKCTIKTGLPIILGSQFNRQVLSVDDILATNIGEAGDIERIATLVVGMWNNNFNENKEDTLFLKVLKNRNGKNGLQGKLLINLNLNKIQVNTTKPVTKKTRQYEF